MNSKKGFTLIELLVVIAIIGILSSVVLASLNSARSKGANASVKANLANMRAEAALWYDSHSSDYSTFCTDPVVASATSSAAVGASAVSCYGTTTSFAIVATFKSPDTSLPANNQGFFCVDGNGYAGGTSSASVNSNFATCK